MRKILQKIAIITLVALFFAPEVAAIVSPTSEFYVNDYADVLSEENEKFIVANSKELEAVTGAQIVVVTVQNLEGKDLESYANELFNAFGIGDKDKNNGVLLLLALEERQSRIEVGDGLEGRLPDGKTGRIQDQYMIPYYRENNFNDGLLNGYKAIYAEVSAEYDYDSGINGTIVATSDDNDEDAEDSALGAITLKAMILILVGALGRKNAISRAIAIVFLEGLTLLIAIYMSQMGLSGWLSFALGTVINVYVVYFLDLSKYIDVISVGGGSGGGSSGGSWSSGGSSSGSSSSGSSGGGGHSSGGGSSRSF